MSWLQNNFTSIKSHLDHPILEACSHQPVTSLPLSCGKLGWCVWVCVAAGEGWWPHQGPGGRLCWPGQWLTCLAWGKIVQNSGQKLPFSASAWRELAQVSWKRHTWPPHLTSSVPLRSTPDSALRWWPWLSPAFQCGRSRAGGPLGHFHPAGLLRFYCGCLISLLFLPQTDALITRFLTCDISLSLFFLFNLFYGDWNILRCGPQACGQDRPQVETDQVLFSPC